MGGSRGVGGIQGKKTSKTKTRVQSAAGPEGSRARPGNVQLGGKTSKTRKNLADYAAIQDFVQEVPVGQMGGLYYTTLIQNKTRLD